MKETVKAKIMLFMSMSIFGTIGVFRKYIPLSSSVISVWRCFFGSVFILVCMRFLRKKLSFTAIKRNFLLLLISGLALGVNMILLFEAYNYTTVAVATLCYYMAPVFVIVTSPIFFRERLSAQKGLCSVMAILGMACISGVFNLTTFKLSETVGISLALGAAIFYATVVICNKFMSDISPLDRTVVQLFFGAVGVFVYTLFTGEIFNVSLNLKFAFLLAVMCIVHTGLAYLLYFSSMQKLSASTVALSSYIDPLLSLLLSVWILGEPLGRYTLIGAVLILGGTFICDLPAIKQKN